MYGKMLRELYNEDYYSLKELKELFETKFYEKVNHISYYKKLADEIFWGKHFVKYYNFEVFFNVGKNTNQVLSGFFYILSMCIYH